MTSNTLVTSETMHLFVIVESGENSAIVRRNAKGLGVFVYLSNSLGVVGVPEFLRNLLEDGKITRVPFPE